MGKIVINENISLDGVVQDPSGGEGFERGGWVGVFKDQEVTGKALLEEALGSDAMLLGRRTYEFFAARWPSRSGALANRFNSMPKYVFSSTIEDAGWNNSTVLSGDVAAAVARLKDEIDGEVVVYGSIQLARALIERDLVDELRLMIYPVVLGAGERLFGETDDMKEMRLVDVRTVGGVAAATYVRFVQDRE